MAGLRVTGAKMGKDDKIVNGSELRRRAEKKLKATVTGPGVLMDMSSEKMAGVIQELRVHQIELEMQNDELRRIQGELEKTRDRYSHLYDFAPVGYFTISEKGIVAEANLTAAALLGVNRSALVGSPFSRFVLRGDQDIFYFLRKRLLETEKTQSCRLRLVKKDGREFHANLECMIVEESDLKQIRIVASDITKQAELENRLRQAHKMEAMGTLAGGIAHQFNNALFAITGNIDLLEMDFPGDETVANYAQRMYNSVRLMTQLTLQLLAYARGGRYQAETLSLRDFVIGTLPAAKYTIDSAIQIDTDLPHDILKVAVDLAQMQMVLSAVLTNASEAIEGKGCVRIACRNEVITDETVGKLPGLKPGNNVSLTITDDGKGMDEETKTRIFEPFFTTKVVGRGLGMAAAYGIVKNHGGFISVDSELGQGTTVKIYLPAVEPPAKEIAKPTPKTGWIKGTGTILVIDDEEAVMNVCLKIFKRLGYRVLGAKTGQEAINIVRTFGGDIDLAMLDILLPDMSGNAIYPFLKEARPDLKVIVFSGYSRDGPAQEILDAGAEDFIQKPFTVSTLSEKLKKAFGGEQ